jgi:hypothetical protein
MENTYLLNRYLPQLRCEALKSNIQTKLAACILKGKKMICKPCCNVDRNIYRGINYGSIHAEANAILTYYGKNLVFDKVKNKWCLLWNKCKVYEKT